MEICCGTGDLAFSLAAGGAEVLGLESCPSQGAIFLERWRTLELNRERISFLPMDVRSLEVSQEVSGVVGLNCFSHVSRGEGEAVCHAVRRHLVPGGMVVFNVRQPLPLRPDQPRGLVAKKVIGHEEFRLFAETKMENSGQDCRVEYTVEAWLCGKLCLSERVVRPLALYRPREISYMLDRAGFSGTEFHSGFDLGAYDEGSPEFVVTARA